MQQLTLRHQVLKLQMYKQFFAVLVGAGILAAISILYQFYLRLSKKPLSWRYTWMLESYSDLVFMGVLVAVAVLWRPRSNNTRYGYGEFFQVDTDGGDNEDNIHEIPLETINVGGGELRKRNSFKSTSRHQQQTQPSAKDTYEADREKNIEKGKYKMTPLDKDIMSIDLDDEGEDGDISIETQLRKMD